MNSIISDIKIPITTYPKGQNYPLKVNSVDPLGYKGDNLISEKIIFSIFNNNYRR
jgi:hypothetical protein